MVCFFCWVPCPPPWAAASFGVCLWLASFLLFVLPFFLVVCAGLVCPPGCPWFARCRLAARLLRLPRLFARPRRVSLSSRPFGGFAPARAASRFGCFGCCLLCVLVCRGVRRFSCSFRSASLGLLLPGPLLPALTHAVHLVSGAGSRRWTIFIFLSNFIIWDFFVSFYQIL